MSDEAPEQSSKTEDPSQKKIEDAHKKGDVAKSQEVTTWFMLLGSAVIFAALAPSTAANLSDQLKLVITNADRFELGGAGFAGFVNGLALNLLGIILLPLVILSACAIAANLIQHRPLL